MIYIFIFLAAIFGLYTWKALAMRKIFLPFTDAYGIRTGKIIRLYRQAADEARKDGINLSPEDYASNGLSQMMKRLAGNDISALRQ